MFADGIYFNVLHNYKCRRDGRKKKEKGEHLYKMKFESAVHVLQHSFIIIRTIC